MRLFQITFTISWSENITNEKLLRRVGKPRTIIKKLKNGQQHTLVTFTEATIMYSWQLLWRGRRETGRRKCSWNTQDYEIGLE